MIGTTLLNRYHIDGELGKGGTGTVYRAHDTTLDRDVAVKVMSATNLDTDSYTRFKNEAQAIAKLNHPNIVSVHDAGETDPSLTSGMGMPFIVMELVKGKSLHDYHPESFEDIFNITKQIFTALEHAHARGIIHRDIKPENVMILSDGRVKLVDFGLALSIVSRLTTEGNLVGTTFYLAPEQALGLEIDQRADLYAVGVTLYELTTGVLPFTADDPFAVITQHLHAPVVPPRARNDKIPKSLDDLIVQLLNKDPADRPSSAADVLRLLEQPGFLETEHTAVEDLSVLERIVRGRLVGRQTELAESRALLRKAAAGESQLLLISGEPGIGKTRLVRELVTQAEVSGWCAFTGVSYAEGDAPYAAFRQIIRQALRNDYGNTQDLSEFVLADLLTLIPELRPHYPDVPANLSIDPQSEKYRLYESVSTFFTNLSDRKPLMLVLEDIHWADNSMLALMSHLARRIRNHCMLIVATYREVALDQARPFQNVLLDLNRDRLTTRIKLPRLDRDQTREVLEILFDEQVAPETLEGIYRETEGNPFFIEEVCRTLVESGKLNFKDGHWQFPGILGLDVPQSVRVAIQARVGKLPIDAQELLKLAAILGREFDFDTLKEAAQVDEETLIDSLENAESAQLIEELSSERGGTFIFAHALIPTTLTTGLSGLRCRRLHLQVMTAIERLRPNDLETLARHALECGDLKKGFEYSLRAAKEANRLFAIEEALLHYDHAREIAESLNDTEQVLTIYEAMGDILGFSDSSQSINAYESALFLTKDIEKRASIKSKIGMRYVYDADSRGLAILEEAIQELDPNTQSNELALATASLGRFHHNRGQHQEALNILEQARQIAEPLDDPRTWSYICIYLAGAYEQLAEFEKSMEWAWHSISFGEQKNYPPSIAIGYEYLTEVSVLKGHWQDAQKYALQELELSKNTGQLIAYSWAEINLSEAFYGLGDLPAAEAAATKSLNRATEMGNFRLAAYAGARLSVIQADLGDLEIAEQKARNAMNHVKDREQMIMMSWCSLYALAYWRMFRNEWEKAFEYLEEAAGIIAKTDNRYFLLLNDPLYAEASLKVGKLRNAKEIIGRALNLSHEAPSPHLEAVAQRVHAQILVEDGKWDDAERDFNTAIANLEQLGSRLELGHAWYHKGIMQSKRGEQESAHVSLTHALEISRDSHAKIHEERIQTAIAALPNDK